MVSARMSLIGIFDFDCLPLFFCLTEAFSPSPFRCFLFLALRLWPLVPELSAESAISSRISIFDEPPSPLKPDESGAFRHLPKIQSMNPIKTIPAINAHAPFLSLARILSPVPRNSIVISFEQVGAQTFSAFKCLLIAPFRYLSLMAGKQNIGHSPSFIFSRPGIDRRSQKIILK